MGHLLLQVSVEARSLLLGQLPGGLRRISTLLQTLHLALQRLQLLRPLVRPCRRRALRLLRSLQQPGGLRPGCLRLSPDGCDFCQGGLFALQGGEAGRVGGDETLGGVGRIVGGLPRIHQLPLHLF